MADLSQLDLGGPSSEDQELEQGEALGLEGESSEEGGSFEADDGHSKTEDLHLYFKQSWKARLGTTGIVCIAFFFITLVMSFATLAFSYTSAGRSFLRGLKILLF